MSWEWECWGVGTWWYFLSSYCVLGLEAAHYGLGSGSDAVKNRRDSLTLLVKTIVPRTQEGSGLGFPSGARQPVYFWAGAWSLVGSCLSWVGPAPWAVWLPVSFLAFPQWAIRCPVVISCRAFLWADVGLPGGWRPVSLADWGPGLRSPSGSLMAHTIHPGIAACWAVGARQRWCRRWSPSSEKDGPNQVQQKRPGQGWGPGLRRSGGDALGVPAAHSGRGVWPQGRAPAGVWEEVGREAQAGGRGRGLGSGGWARGVWGEWPQNPVFCCCLWIHGVDVEGTLEGEKTCGIGLVTGTVRVRWRDGGGLGTGVEREAWSPGTLSRHQWVHLTVRGEGELPVLPGWLRLGFLGVWRCRTGGQQGRACVGGKNGLPVSPLGKEFESAVESGDKPGVWTKGRNVERWQDVGPVEAWCLLHS